MPPQKWPFVVLHDHLWSHLQGGIRPWTVCIGRQCHYDQTGNKKPSHFFHNAFWIINRIPTMPHHHNICNKLLQKQGTRPLQALHINGTKKRSPNPWDYQDFTFGFISMCLSISLSTKERICKFKHMRTTQKKRHTTTLQNTAKASFMQKGYSADTNKSYCRKFGSFHVRKNNSIKKNIY